MVVFIMARVVSPLEGETEVTAGASAHIRCECCGVVVRVYLLCAITYRHKNIQQKMYM